MEAVEHPNGPKAAVDSNGRPLVSPGELAKLCAVDNELYGRVFFPKTFRQASPPFQREMWHELEDNTARFVNLKVFRGGAKTTVSRVFTSKRIAYGVSKTILYVGASETAAVRSSLWLRNNVVRNKLWASTFGLKPGGKWTDTEFEVQHSVLRDPHDPDRPFTIWLTFVGITGNIRGINFEDYRPDLIVLDDIITDENAATEEQRVKIDDLVHGAVKNSLAPIVDEPNAKMAMLVTPQHKEDVSSKAGTDPSWRTVEAPCWTKATIDLDVDQQESAWPERFSTTQLREDKLSAISRNRLATFVREMEVRLVSRESAAFLAPWLQHYDEIPDGCTTMLGIDPVPPPSERELAKGLQGKDYEVLQVWGRRGDKCYLLDRVRSRGHDPSWTIMQTFRLAMEWKVSRIIVESVNYQRTLKWLLEQEMARMRKWYIIKASDASKNKYARITSVLNGPAAMGKLFVKKTHSEFITQFETYPSVDHDDELDCASIVLSNLMNPYVGGYADSQMAEVEEITRTRGAP